MRGKLIKGLALGLSALGIASLCNVKANALATTKSFTELQTMASLKFSYNTESYEPNYDSIRIKFGGLVGTDTDGYNNLSNYEYGVIVLADNGDVTKTELQATTSEKLAEYKSNGFAKECKVSTIKEDKSFEYSWVIKNTDLTFTYCASMYRVDKTTNKLEVAIPRAASISTLCDEYALKKGNGVTTPVKNALAKIADSLGTEYSISEEALRPEGEAYTPAEADVLWAYAFGDNIVGHFTKVDRNTMKVKLNSKTTQIKLGYVPEGIVPSIRVGKNNMKGLTPLLTIPSDLVYKSTTYKVDKQVILGALKNHASVPNEYSLWAKATGEGLPVKEFKIEGDKFTLDSKYTNIMFVLNPVDSTEIWDSKTLSHCHDMYLKDGNYYLSTMTIKTSRNKINEMLGFQQPGKTEHIFAVCSKDQDAGAGEYWIDVTNAEGDNIELRMPAYMNRIRFVIAYSEVPVWPVVKESGYTEFSNGYVK